MKNGMMKRINSHGTAFIISVILILAGFLIGGTRPLNKLRAEGCAVFYNGTEDYGPNSFNLIEDLTVYNGLAANAEFIGERYLGRTSPQVAAVRDAREALAGELENTKPLLRADKLCAALDTLRGATEELAKAVRSQSAVNAKDLQAFEENAVNMASKYTVIGHAADTYNTQAAAYNEKLARLPASLFKITGLVKRLYLFID